MKAQLSVEYYLSLTLFIGFIVYISFQVMRISPQFITEVKNERLKSEAYQISELLINDAGEPTNWYNISLNVYPNPPCDSYGDVNDDGIITLSDAQWIAEYIGGSRVLTDEQVRIGNVTGDKFLDISDELFIAQYANGLRSTFPICVFLLTNRIGLSDERENVTNYLSKEKITAFNTACNSDYENVRRLTGIGTDYYFSLNLVDSNGQTLIDCNPPLAVIKPVKIAITRIVALNQTTFGELTLQLW